VKHYQKRGKRWVSKFPVITEARIPCSDGQTSAAVNCMKRLCRRHLWLLAAQAMPSLGANSLYFSLLAGERAGGRNPGENPAGSLALNPC
jgi:hypothetical protein